jgi:hypothetical protein
MEAACTPVFLKEKKVNPILDHPLASGERSTTLHPRPNSGKRGQHHIPLVRRTTTVRQVVHMDGKRVTAEMYTE